MRKRIVPSGPSPVAAPGDWLDVERLCSVEVSSEDAAHPIENAFSGRTAAGWKASVSGPQTLRLYFDAPQRIRRIDLEVVEAEMERTQELAIAWTNSAGARHELRRQRWNFSPGGSTLEHEDYRVDLEALTMLEIVIDPDVSGPAAFATLRSLRLG